MKKITAGFVCVLLAVIIAMISVGCGSGNNELTYTGDYQASSSSGYNTSPTESSVSQTSGAETMLYPLTTQQGETVIVVPTTAPSTEVPTMSYDPVTVSPIPTEYTSSTTAYVPPTYSPSASNQVSTQPVTTTTTEATTEKTIKYKNVNGNADGGVDGNKIKVWVDNIFGDKIKAKSGSVTIDYASKTYKASCKVLSKLYAGEQVEIDIDIPSDLASSVESSGESLISITVPKGMILSEDNISNNAFRVTISASDL